MYVAMVTGWAKVDEACQSQVLHVTSTSSVLNLEDKAVCYMLGSLLGIKSLILTCVIGIFYPPVLTKNGNMCLKLNLRTTT